ncbi:unnamed protein product, partial [Rotaria sp. Silwood1]
LCVVCIGELLYKSPLPNNAPRSLDRNICELTRYCSQ